MDVTPLVLADRQVVNSYGKSGFRVSGAAYDGAIIVFPDRTQAWAATSFAEVTMASLEPVIAHGDVQILLLGCGTRQQLVPAALRQALRQAGIVIEGMDTGAACRTYNVLLSEDRRVAAALLPTR